MPIKAKVTVPASMLHDLVDRINHNGLPPSLQNVPSWKIVAKFDEDNSLFQAFPTFSKWLVQNGKKAKASKSHFSEGQLTRIDPKVREVLRIGQEKKKRSKEHDHTNRFSPSDKNAPKRNHCIPTKP